MDLNLLKSRITNYIFFQKKMRIFKKKSAVSYDGRILYFDPAMHLNLGDQTQKYCIRNWLKENYPDYEVLEIPARIIVDDRFSFLKTLKKNVKPDDIIVFQSGYCTHDLGTAQADKMHRMVITAFPDNRILMMPQTVYFQSAERKKLTSEEYSKANRMLFLARDKVSYELAKEMFPSIPVRLYPDIVTTLIGTKEYHEKRNGIFLCCRKDIEKYYSDEEIERLEEKLTSVCPVHKGDTSISDCNPYWLDKNLDSKLDGVFREYASYKLVITDRYHGTIFSLIAGTPVIVIKTKDHKVSTGVDWFKGVYDYVSFAETLDEAYEKAMQILKDEKTNVPAKYFKEEYYDKLKTLFDECTSEM